jgi:hypothetical protein
MFSEEKFQVFTYKLSTYRLFVSVFLILFILRNFKGFKYFKQNGLFIILYCSIAFIPYLSQYYFWGISADHYLITMLKPSWVFVFLFIDLDKDFYKKMSVFTAFSCLFISLVTLIPSLRFYLNLGMPYWRTPEIETKFLQYSFPLNLNNKILPFIYISEISSMSWSTCSGFMSTFLLTGLLNKKKKWYFLFFILLKLLFLYLNVGLKLFLSFFIQVFIFFKKINFLKIKYVIIFSFLFYFFSIFVPELNRRLRVEYVNIDTTSRKIYINRLSVLRHTLLAAIKFNPVKGNGIPSKLNEINEILPSGVSNIHSSAHSEFLDKIFYFGFPSGLLLFLLRLAPLLIFLKYINPKKFLDLEDKVSILSFFTLLPFNWIFGLFGGDVYSNVFFIFSLVISLNLLKNSSNSGSHLQ